MAAVAVALLVGPAAAGAQTAAERQLAERYAPVMMLKENPDPPCSRRGEQYVPSPVTITLGNPEVRLRRPPSRGAYEQAGTLATAPTAADLAGLGADFYLDLPGHPRRPGWACGSK